MDGSPCALVSTGRAPGRCEAGFGFPSPHCFVSQGRLPAAASLSGACPERPWRQERWRPHTALSRLSYQHAVRSGASTLPVYHSLERLSAAEVRSARSYHFRASAGDPHFDRDIAKPRRCVSGPILGFQRILLSAGHLSDENDETLSGLTLLVGGLASRWGQPALARRGQRGG